MMKKNVVFFLGFFCLFLGFVSGQQKFDINYFLNQPDKILSPVSPWFSERPKNVTDFLAFSKTPYRTKWQPKPVPHKYRFSKYFLYSDYERWRHLDSFGGSSEEENFSGQYCYDDDSTLQNEFLTDIEIAGRCCVCRTGGEWKCQYSHVKEGRECQAPDLAIKNVVFTEDESFSSSSQRKYFFDAIIKNNGDIPSDESTVSIKLNEEEIASRTFPALQKNEQLSISQLLFPSIGTGIIIPEGEYEVMLKVSTAKQDFEELNTENNEHIELLSVEPPQHDFLVGSVNVFQTGNINELGEEELRFQVDIKNEGSPLATVPEKYTLELLTNPEFPAFYSETIEQNIFPGDSFMSEFNVYGEAGSYTFFVKVIPSSEDEARLENNILEVPFTVHQEDSILSH